MGIDRELVGNLRRALAERVAGWAPSEASWLVVRQRTVDRPESPWTSRVLHWGGMVSAAAAAGIMLFAVATAPEARLLGGAQSPFIADAARRAVPPVEEATGFALAPPNTYVPPQTDPPLPGQRMQLKLANDPGARDEEPPITGRMR
jgi:hypothetical protein